MAEHKGEGERVWAGLGHFLEGLVFPARPIDMLRHAQRQRHQERVHEEILQRVKRLPDREYRNLEEVRRDIDSSDTH